MHYFLDLFPSNAVSLSYKYISLVIYIFGIFGPQFIFQTGFIEKDRHFVPICPSVQFLQTSDFLFYVWLKFKYKFSKIHVFGG